MAAGLIMLLLGVFLILRTVVKDSSGNTLVGHVLNL
jgi:hypothetical protein